MRATKFDEFQETQLFGSDICCGYNVMMEKIMEATTLYRDYMRDTWGIYWDSDFLRPAGTAHPKSEGLNLACNSMAGWMGT